MTSPDPQIVSQIADAISQAKPFLAKFAEGPLSDEERKALAMVNGIATAADKIAAGLGGPWGKSVSAIVEAVINAHGLEAVTAWFELFRHTLAKGATIAIEIGPLGPGVELATHGSDATS